MADFCKQCSEDNFNEDFGDLRGLVEGEDLCVTLCEGCGICIVDKDGKCVSKDCMKHHGDYEPHPDLKA